MLTVTDAALARLSRKLEHKNAADDVALRFRRGAGLWQLREDRARPDDATFAHAGRNVLLLDAAAATAMTSLTLTVKKTGSGPRLRLRRNEKSER